MTPGAKLPLAENCWSSGGQTEERKRMKKAQVHVLVQRLPGASSHSQLWFWNVLCIVVWELSSAAGKPSGIMRPKPSVWSWAGPQTWSIPWHQTVPLIPCSCSFRNSLFWTTKILLPVLILQPSTSQGASVRNTLGVHPQSLFEYTNNVSIEFYFPSIYPKGRHILLNPFFLINETENSFHIRLYSVTLFFCVQLHSIPSHKYIFNLSLTEGYLYYYF